MIREDSLRHEANTESATKPNRLSLSLFSQQTVKQLQLSYQRLCQFIAYISSIKVSKSSNSNYQNKLKIESCETVVQRLSTECRSQQSNDNHSLSQHPNNSQFRSNKCVLAPKQLLELCDKLTIKQLSQIKCLDYNGALALAQERVKKMTRSRKIKTSWSKDDVKLLIWVIRQYWSVYGSHRNPSCFAIEKEWAEISQLIPGTTGQQCMFRWLSLKKCHLTQVAWSSNESKFLAETARAAEAALVPDQQIDWNIVSQQVYLRNCALGVQCVYRTSKQCKERWNCFENPTIKKGLWTQNENFSLLSLFKSIGYRKKWSLMVPFFEGRTQNSIKNRFELLIRNLKKTQRMGNTRKLIDKYLEKHRHCQAVPGVEAILSGKLISEAQNDDCSVEEQVRQRAVQSNVQAEISRKASYEDFKSQRSPNQYEFPQLGELSTNSVINLNSSSSVIFTPIPSFVALDRLASCNSFCESIHPFKPEIAENKLFSSFRSFSSTFGEDKLSLRSDDYPAQL